MPSLIEEIGGGERRGQREIEREIADILVPHPLVDLLAQPVQRARLFVVAGERKQQKETTARRLQRRVRRQLERREQPADGDFDNQLEAQRAAAKIRDSPRTCSERKRKSARWIPERSPAQNRNFCCSRSRTAASSARLPAKS